MTKVDILRLCYDVKGKTLSIWFNNPGKEYVSEEVGDGVILNKDRQGRVIGFEKLNVSFSHLAKVKSLPVEVMFSEAS